MISTRARSTLENIRVKHDIPGMAISLVRSPRKDQDHPRWDTETICSGVANSAGDPVDTKVSSRPKLYVDRLVRASAYTGSFLPSLCSA